MENRTSKDHKDKKNTHNKKKKKKKKTQNPLKRKGRTDTPRTKEPNNSSPKEDPEIQKLKDYVLRRTERERERGFRHGITSTLSLTRSFFLLNPRLRLVFS